MLEEYSYTELWVLFAMAHSADKQSLRWVDKVIFLYAVSCW